MVNEVQLSMAVAAKLFPSLSMLNWLVEYVTGELASWKGLGSDYCKIYAATPGVDVTRILHHFITEFLVIFLFADVMT